MGEAIGGVGSMGGRLEGPPGGFGCWVCTSTWVKLYETPASPASSVILAMAMLLLFSPDNMLSVPASSDLYV